MDILVSVVGARSIYASGIVIERKGQAEVVMALPFRGEPVHFAGPLNDKEVLVAGSYGSLAVCDAASGRTLRAAQSERSFPKVLILRDGERFLIYSRHEIWVWRREPLELLTRFNGRIPQSEGWSLHDSPLPRDASDETVLAGWRKERRAIGFEPLALYEAPFRECADGRVLADHSEQDRHGSIRQHGVYQIDPSDWSVELFASRKDAGDIPVPKEDVGWAKPRTEHLAAFDAFVNKTTMVEQPFEAYDAACVEAALSSLRTRVEAELTDLIWGEYLRVRFVFEGSDVSEEDFYQALFKRELPVTQALRQLILAYLERIEGGEGSQPWSDGEEGIAAFGQAVRALVLLDPGSLDVLRLYMTKRDGEHESFCGDVVLPDFLKRHGWHDEAVLGFGVFFAINRIWGGRGPENRIWNEYGLIDAASAMMTAEAFAELVLAELRSHDLEPQWNHQEPKGPYYLSSLVAGLDPSDRYHQSLRRALEEKCPEPFG